MAQVTVYIEDELESRMRAAAQAANLSHSRWLANLIRERLAVQWPHDVAALAGAWRDSDDFPEAETLRANLGTDAAREHL
ncbi:MAG: CopG family transcriptional regulator [Myxococcota bacterium]